MPSGGSSSPAGSTVSTQNTAPWGGQQPFLTGAPNSGSLTEAAVPNSLGSNYVSGATIPGTNIPVPGAGGVGTPQATEGALPGAAELYQNYAPQYYPGTTYSPETSAQSSALTGAENLGLSGSPITGAASNAALGILNPDFLTSNPGNSSYAPFTNSSFLGSNPGTSAYSPFTNSSFLNSNPGNAAYSDILNGGANVQSAISQALPGLLDSFTAGNRLNSPGAAYGVGQGLGTAVGGLELQAGQGLSQNYANAANQSLTGAQGVSQNYANAANQALAAAQGQSQNYSNAAGQQNTANLTAPGVQSLGYTDLSNALSAGTTQQGLNQNTINDAITRYNYGQTLPYNLLDQYASGVNGAYGNTSSLNTPYYTQQSGGLGGALSGALSGSALGGLLGGGSTGSTGIGALLGGLLGGFA